MLLGNECPDGTVSVSISVPFTEEVKNVSQSQVAFFVFGRCVDVEFGVEYTKKKLRNVVLFCHLRILFFYIWIKKVKPFDIIKIGKLPKFYQPW